MLAGIFVLLALMLIPTLRGYLSQRAQIDALETEVATRQAAVDQLQGDLARWSDPAFVEQQARQRLKFVRPGETSYQVIDVEGLSGRDLSGTGSVVRPETTGETTWYSRMWSSLDAADSLSPQDVSAPLAPIDPAADERPGAPAASGVPPAPGTSAPAQPGGTQASTPPGTDATREPPAAGTPSAADPAPERSAGTARSTAPGSGSTRTVTTGASTTAGTATRTAPARSGPATTSPQ